jgi:His/Glu/Gln/Arg/opine family amino acid ABC transporter permease subunit
MHLDWQFLSDPDRIAALTDGFWMTLILFVGSSIGAVLVGLVLTAMRVSTHALSRKIAMIYTDIVRNVPLLISLFFVYFGLTSVFPPISFPVLRTPHLGDYVTVITISLVMGGFVSEVIRQGIEAVPVGQIEAAVASGLDSLRVYRHVVFPQLLPLVLPGLASEIVNTLKRTTFAKTLGVADLMWEGQRIESETFRGVEVMTVITLVYFLISIATIAIFRFAEQRCRTPQPRS